MNSKSGTVSPDNSDCSERDKFSVSFTHRLHFTEDIFGRQRGILVNLIERSGDHKTRVQVWLDSYVAEAQPNLRTQLEALFDELRATVTLCGIHVCIGGEEVKNSWCHVEGILSAINDANLDRRSYVLVIGGGAVLDAVGFAAATAHRGIRLIRLPTTTLAQADSGVGVKNAVNRFGKKNWLGTFAVPWAVINDSSLIDTLPDRQFRAGFSEAVKVALLKSKSGFEALEKNAQSVREREPAAWIPTVKLSAELHLNHITRGGDPFESRQARPLDFGHWLAHRLEAITSFSVSHGEAVGIGVAIDTVYSVFAHGFPAMDAQRVLRTLSNLGLPLFHEAVSDFENIFQGMEEFRQHLGGDLTVTMLRAIGDPLEVHEIQKSLMIEACRRVETFYSHEIQSLTEAKAA